MDFVRARSREQKELRLKEIMEAADALFHESTYHGATLTTIAERLGWARGNLYKYVATKEEIFLELYKQKHLAWVAAVDEAFRGVDALPVEDFAARWSQVLEARDDFLKYQNILALIIETNLPVEVLAAFKKDIWTVRRPLVDAVARQCPWLSEPQIRSFLLAQIYHACGLYNHIHLSPNLIEALRIAEIPVREESFADGFAHFLLTQIRGMQAERTLTAQDP